MITLDFQNKFIVELKELHFAQINVVLKGNWE